MRESMNFVRSCGRILRRDKDLTRDDFLFVGTFGGVLFVIVLLVFVTMVFGDGPSFFNWLFGRTLFKDT